MSLLLYNWRDHVFSGYSNCFNKQMFYQTAITGEWSEMDWKYTDLGFTNKRYSKLSNRYIIGSSVDKFMDNLSTVKDGAVLMRFGNKEKVGKNRDFCLVGLSVAMRRGKVVGMDIYIRSSEMACQLLVDMLFLQTILRECGFEPVGVYTRICITSGFTAKMFFPIFYKICKLKFNEDMSKKFKKGRAYLKKLDDEGSPSWRLAARASNAYLQMKDKRYKHNIALMIGE